MGRLFDKGKRILGVEKNGVRPERKHERTQVRNTITRRKVCSERLLYFFPYFPLFATRNEEFSRCL